MTTHEETKRRLSPEQEEVVIHSLPYLVRTIKQAEARIAGDTAIADLVNRAEILVWVLEDVDQDHSLQAADPGRCDAGIMFADSDHDGFRAHGIWLLLRVCAEHPEVTGPLITRLADRFRTTVLDEDDHR